MSEQLTQTKQDLTPLELQADQTMVAIEQPEIAQRPEGLAVRHMSFEDAQQAKKKYSDQFIDGALAEYAGSALPFKVGTESVGLKGYLDKVEATSSDKAIIDNPEAIAGLYLDTTEMVARNLKIYVAKGAAPERLKEIATAKTDSVTRLKDEALENADKIVAWAEAADQRIAPRPGEAFGYYGFKIGEGDQAVDVFDQGGKKAPDFHPNIKVQRQGGGNFIYGYSDARITQRMGGQKESLGQRIYLNPEAMATPHVFEKVLQAASKAGLPIELKMFQRSEEFGAAHIQKSRDPSSGDALRGDGVVIYTSNESANDVLALALAIAQDQPEAFAGRKTSRIPQAVAEGVAVGSEPVQRAGQDPESLTSSRARILSTVAQKVSMSGKTGQAARDAFRRGVDYYAHREGIDSSNIAFNAVH